MWLDEFVLVDTSRIKNRKKYAKMENDRRYVMEFMEKFNIAMNRYRILNLPETISDRVVLQSMIIHGNAIFFRLPEFGENLFCLPGVPEGSVNINGDYTKAHVYSKNGLINKEIDLYIKGSEEANVLNKGITQTFDSKNPNGVIVWENKNRFPFIFTVDYFARAISDTYRTIDVAKAYMKRPFIPICEESMVASVEEILGKIISNEEVVPVSTGVKSVDSINFHDIIGMGDSVKDAMELLEWYEQKYREKCSIQSNTQADKKGENLTTDEISVNDEFIDIQDDTMIDYLQSQFDIVNEQFGTNIKVDVYDVKKGDSQDGNDDGNNISRVD